MSLFVHFDNLVVNSPRIFKNVSSKEPFKQKSRRKYFYNSESDYFESYMQNCESKCKINLKNYITSYILIEYFQIQFLRMYNE